MKIRLLIALVLFGFLFASCGSEKEVNEAEEPLLIVKFKFDPDQERLNNLGQPSEVPAGNAAQTPDFNFISSHYLEFAPTATTALGKGTVLYHAPETKAGGENAIDFNKARIVAEGETFFSIPLKEVAAGDYEWVRCSLSYQDYDIKGLVAGNEVTATVASFVGFNTYITNFTSGGYSFDVNGNRKQGFWAFGLQGYNYSTSGQAPEGATTVPNPIQSTSPIPKGSCVVTGKFTGNPLTITGKETKDVVVTLSLSINKSFEWTEVNADGKYEPAAGEKVVDMGLRGLIPSFQN